MKKIFKNKLINLFQTPLKKGKKKKKAWEENFKNFRKYEKTLKKITYYSISLN